MFPVTSGVILCAAKVNSCTVSTEPTDTNTHGEFDLLFDGDRRDRVGRTKSISNTAARLDTISYDWNISSPPPTVLYANRANTLPGFSRHRVLKKTAGNLCQYSSIDSAATDRRTKRPERAHLTPNYRLFIAGVGRTHSVGRNPGSIRITIRIDPDRPRAGNDPHNPDLSNGFKSIIANEKLSLVTGRVARSVIYRKCGFERARFCVAVNKTVIVTVQTHWLNLIFIRFRSFNRNVF